MTLLTSLVIKLETCIKKIPYSLVVGEKEIESSSFTLRSKKGDNHVLILLKN